MKPADDEDDLVTEMRGQIKSGALLRLHIAPVIEGRSILTAQLKMTGERMTFRFTTPLEHTGQHGRPCWVSILGGNREDGHSWHFAGTLWPYRYDTQVTFSPKVKFLEDSPERRAVLWLSTHLKRMDVLIQKADWWHEGRCGRCGRRLTVPESIETGFGPECRKAVGL